MDDGYAHVNRSVGDDRSYGNIYIKKNFNFRSPNLGGFDDYVAYGVTPDGVLYIWDVSYSYGLMTLPLKKSTFPLSVPR